MISTLIETQIYGTETSLVITRGTAAPGCSSMYTTIRLSLTIALTLPVCSMPDCGICQMLRNLFGLRHACTTLKVGTEMARHPHLPLLRCFPVADKDENDSYAVCQSKTKGAVAIQAVGETICKYWVLSNSLHTCTVHTAVH